MFRFLILVIFVLLLYKYVGNKDNNKRDSGEDKNIFPQNRYDHHFWKK